MSLNLELNILQHLANNENGKFIDITFIDEDYEGLSAALEELQGRNMLVVDSSKRRDFSYLGIQYKRKKMLRAKINNNGKIYLHQLQSKQLSKTRKKRSWKLAYLFNF